MLVFVQGAYLQPGPETSAEHSQYQVWTAPRRARKSQSVCTGHSQRQLSA